MTDQKITMDGKWAYRHDPFTQVRLLCVDGAHKEFPVVSMGELGEAVSHTSDGSWDRFYDLEEVHDLDLVPLQEKRKPREVWIVERIGGLLAFYSEVDAENALRNYHQSHKPLRFREVTDEEPILSEPIMEAWKEEDDRVNMNVAAVIKQTTGWGG